MRIEEEITQGIIKENTYNHQVGKQYNFIPHIVLSYKKIQKIIDI